MEHTIQKLTDLIGIITEKVPDENDLKGFPQKSTDRYT